MSIPEVRFDFAAASSDEDGEPVTDKPGSPERRFSHPSRPSTPTTPVYYGSYANSAASTPPISRSSSRPRLPASLSQTQLQALLPKQHTALPDFGLQEDRDGFFDANFYTPTGLTLPPGEVLDGNGVAVPGQRVEKKHDPLSVPAFPSRQLEEIISFFRQLRTRKGIRVLRSVLGIWIAFVLCLVPGSWLWLGRYSYVSVISALINHSGRSVGSQLDGLVMTCLGTFAGLSWGALALYTSTSIASARNAYGNVLATFLLIFTVFIAMVRCLFIRFYQAVICAGIAGAYVVLSEAGDGTDWVKVKAYGIPFVIGQGISLLVAALVFPTAGARSMGYTAVHLECGPCANQRRQTFHEALICMRHAVQYPRADNSQTNRDLAHHFVKISTAIRDFTLDLTVSRIRAEDARSLRNDVQRVIRTLLSLRPNQDLWAMDQGQPPSGDGVFEMIKNQFRYPLLQLLDTMSDSIYAVDNELCQLSSLLSKHLVDCRKLEDCIEMLIRAQLDFDRVDAELVSKPETLTAHKYDVNVIELFLLVHPIRQASNAILSLLRTTSSIKSRARWRVQAPSYPWHKAVLRSNKQVRHDRGGLNAGFYFRTKKQLDHMIASLSTMPNIPEETRPAVYQSDKTHSQTTRANTDVTAKPPRSRKLIFRTYAWRVLHRLQGFESRFALKVAVVTTLLSIPAYLPQSRVWWNTNQSWWTIVTVWLMMHPRVGGTFQDLFTRCFCAVLGALYGALTAAAGRAVASDVGGKIVVAAMAAVFLVPMVYRFTISSHPRSGFMGCVAFIVVALELATRASEPVVRVAWTRGLAFVVGIVCAVVVNWVLWPFVARHELRKSVSAMMIHQALLYRAVISKYVYFGEGKRPGEKDVERSEILEERVREGFVRMRQLLEMTGHEIRLRAPFDPAPYSALISTLETLFEHLVRLRQSSLYFQPNILTPDPSMLQILTAPRRDAVAAILMNLYILGCSLRTDSPVPRYLPGPAMARKKLLDKMETLEAEYEARKRGLALQIAKMESPRSEDEDDTPVSDSAGEVKPGEKLDLRRRWDDVYHYAFSSALTEIVASIQQLQRWSRKVVGEESW